MYKKQLRNVNDVIGLSNHTYVTACICVVLSAFSQSTLYCQVNSKISPGISHIGRASSTARKDFYPTKADKSLWDAIVKNSPDSVSKAIRDGASVNRSSYTFGMNPINYVVENWCPEGPHKKYLAQKKATRIIRKLIFAGADLNRTSEQQIISPLRYAIETNDEGLVRLMLHHRAKVNTQDRNGYTPLLIAAENGETKISVLLISVGADLNVQTRRGQYSPIMYCAENNNILLAKELLKHHSNLEFTSEDDETAVDIAKRHKYSTMERLLKLRNLKK